MPTRDFGNVALFRDDPILFQNLGRPTAHAAGIDDFNQMRLLCVDVKTDNENN